MKVSPDEKGAQDKKTENRVPDRAADRVRKETEMKNNREKWIAMVLCVALCFSLSPTPSLAETASDEALSDGFLPDEAVLSEAAADDRQESEADAEEEAGASGEAGTAEESPDGRPDESSGERPAGTSGENAGAAAETDTDTDKDRHRHRHRDSGYTFRYTLEYYKTIKSA